MLGLRPRFIYVQEKWSRDAGDIVLFLNGVGGDCLDIRPTLIKDPPRRISTIPLTIAFLFLKAYSICEVITPLGIL